MSYNATEAIENIYCAESERTVDDSTDVRLF